MDAFTWKMISIAGYSLAVVLFVTAAVMFFKMNIRAIIGDLTGKTAARQIQEIRERSALADNKRYKPAAFHLDRGTLTEASGTAGDRTGRKMGKTAQALAHASKRLDGKAMTGGASRSMINERIGFHNPESLSGEETVVLPSEAFEHETEVLGYDNRTDDTKVCGDENGTEILTDILHNQSETEVLIDGTVILEAGKSTEMLPVETEFPGDDYGTEVLSPDDETTLSNPTEELEEYENAIPMVDFKMVKDIKIIHTSEVI